MKRLLLALAFLATPALYGTDFHVGPNGVGTSGCTANVSPWCSLDYARDTTLTNHSDDTIWYHGGTYTVSNANLATNFYGFGTAGHPMIHRNWNNERAILTYANPPVQTTISVAGAYQWFWGLEFTQTNIGSRVSSIPGSVCPECTFGGGVDIRINLGPLPGIKFINCIFHDTASAIGFWDTAINGEMYGNLSYYNGWTGPDRGHGHGMYIQSAQSGDAKVLKHNIVFRNANHGFHSYGSSAVFANNLTYDSNIAFGNSDIPEVGGGGRDWLIGGSSVAFNDLVKDNVFYRSAGWQFGWSNWPANSSTSSTITGNYIYEPAPAFVNVLIPAGVTFGGAGPLANTVIYDSLQGFTTADFPLNTYSTPRSAYAGATFVKANINTYEPDRCDLAIHNPSGASTVAVNLNTKCGFNTNDSINVRYVGDFFGTAINTVYAGGNYAVPMTGWVESDPAGSFSAPATYFPYFGAFVIYRTAAVSTPTPTLTPTFTNTATPTNTPTSTPTNTPVNTATPTFTPTSTPTPAAGACTYIMGNTATLAGNMAIGNDALAYGGQYISSPTTGASDTATFTFSLPNGTYYFSHRVIGALDTTDSFFTSRDGEADTTHIDDIAEQTWSPAWQTTRMTDRAIGGPSAGNPAQFQSSLVIADSPANHTLRLRAREAGAKLNWIAVCPNQSVPADPGTPTNTPTPSPTLTPTNTLTPTSGPTPTPTQPGVGPEHIHMCWDPITHRSRRIRHQHAPAGILQKHRHLYCGPVL